MLDESKPLFIAVAEQIEDGILDGTYPEDTPVPSTNELAAFLRINPATAGKGLNRLADAGVLVKRRGVGMFVAPGAADLLRQRRRDDFARDYIVPLLREAAHLGIAPHELTAMITTEAPR
ncbi:MAG TPA: GntR family transcriptional regulator [Candidatus Brachybacterium merdigallinarum]|nr:GntR family transcriptional regulator [Candidatus Brachybacterium merdigallinarum]